MTPKKTSLYIDTDLDFALAKRAERDGLTKAELIRRALRAVVEDGGQARPSVFAAFDGPADLSDRVDDYLGEGFGRE